MKVTPRLPMHLPDVNPHQFPEVRYFRFGPDSYLAATLFDFFEELRLPCFQSLRNNYFAYIRDRSLQRAEILLFLLQPRVKVECLLAAWNYGIEFVMLVAQAVSEFFQREDIHLAIGEVLQRGPRGNQEQADSYYHPRIYTLPGNENTAVLVYPYLALESFAVTPCSHIYTKLSMFTQARQMMQEPKRENEVADHLVSCVGCHKPIGKSVYQIARRATNLYAADLPQRIFQHFAQQEKTDIVLYHTELDRRCTYCGLRHATLECCGACKVCIECAVVASCSFLYLCRCPACGQKLRRNAWPKVIEQMATMCTWPTAKIDTVDCDWCLEMKPVVDIKEICHENLWLLVCNTCHAGITRAHPSPLPASEMRPPALTTEEAKERASKCGHCGTLRRIQEFKFYLSYQHRCLICDACYYQLLYTNAKLTKCPKCSKGLPSNLGSKYSQVIDKPELPNSFCDVCEQQYDPREFSEGRMLSHWWKCRICNACLSTYQSIAYQMCIACNNPYTDNDKAALEQFLSTLRRLPSSPAEAVQLGDILECELCKRESSNFLITKSAKKHRCKVCDECWTALIDCHWNDACPVCKVSLFAADIQKMQGWRAKRVRVPEMNTEITCWLCSKSKPRKEMLKRERLRHTCSVCDVCLISMKNPATCPVCTAPYQEPDFIIVAKLIGSASAPPKPRDNPAPSEPAQRGFRYCPHAIRDTKPKCVNACMCSLCFLQSYAFTNDRNCPKCNLKLVGPLPDHMQCSRCSRQLTIPSKPSNAVFGICENSCVLCCFCIRIENKQTTCTNCGQPTQVHDLKNIKKLQQKFRLGCYCGKDIGSTLTLTCGHMAHSDCFPSLRACRICGYEYRQKFQGPSLRSYIS